VELVLRVVHKHDDAADASLGGIVVEKGKSDTGQFIPERERDSLDTLLVVLEESLLLSITKEHLYFCSCRILRLVRPIAMKLGDVRVCRTRHARLHW
jgi:hypothetical protein